MIILFWILMLAPLAGEAERARFLEPAEDVLFASEWEQSFGSAVREVLLEEVVGEPLVRAMQREAFRGGGKIQLAPGDGSQAAVDADTEAAGSSPGTIELEGATLLVFARSALDCGPGAPGPLFCAQPAAQAGPAGWPIESGSRLPQSKEASPRNAGNAVSHPDRIVQDAANTPAIRFSDPGVFEREILNRVERQISGLKSQRIGSGVRSDLKNVGILTAWNGESIAVGYFMVEDERRGATSEGRSGPFRDLVIEIVRYASSDDAKVAVERSLYSRPAALPPPETYKGATLYRYKRTDRLICRSGAFVVEIGPLSAEGSSLSVKILDLVLNQLTSHPQGKDSVEPTSQ